MLVNTEAIVIKCVKFRETSIIAHVLTPENGTVPLIVSGVRSKKNKGKAAQFQIGQLLNIVFYDKQKEGVMRLKESSVSTPFVSIPFKITKIALAQYFVEVTRNCIYQSAIVSDDVYYLLKNGLLFLDKNDNTNVNLATYFLWQLIDCLGLAPHLELETDAFFDLEVGSFSPTMPRHKAALTLPVVRKLRLLMSTPFNDLDAIGLMPAERKQLLEAGHIYLKLHLSYFKLPKSADIFRDILKV